MSNIKKEIVEKVLNRCLSEARYKLVKRVMQMSEKELIILHQLIGLEGSPDSQSEVLVEKVVGFIKEGQKLP